MADAIDTAYEQATKKLHGVGDDIAKLPKSVSTFLLVYSAQGVIDNGGYQYFFESDWPGNPAYSTFIDAYREIGCEQQAADFARVVSSFPFETPHLHESARNTYMCDNLDEDEREVKGWGDALCGDEEVWSTLANYYLQNKEHFV